MEWSTGRTGGHARKMKTMGPEDQDTPTHAIADYQAHGIPTEEARRWQYLGIRPAIAGAIHQACGPRQREALIAIAAGLTTSGDLAEHLGTSRQAAHKLAAKALANAKAHLAAEGVDTSPH